ncbi:hypothetical protein Ancab_018637 [Ancistrocladus abbreviatus]
MDEIDVEEKMDEIEKLENRKHSIDICQSREQLWTRCPEFRVRRKGYTVLNRKRNSTGAVTCTQHQRQVAYSQSRSPRLRQDKIVHTEIAREGLDFKDKSVGSILAGPILARLPNSVEDNVPTQGALAQISPRVSAQEVQDVGELFFCRKASCDSELCTCVCIAVRWELFVL